MDFNIAASKSGAAWEEAKNKGNFFIFKPHLEKIVQFKRSFAEYFGYFPSYALGNLYGARFLYKLKKDVKDLYKEIETGNFSSIFNWLKENIHKHGVVYKPRAILKMVTGDELSAKHFLEYLNEKYSAIYNL